MYAYACPASRTRDLSVLLPTKSVVVSARRYPVGILRKQPMNENTKISKRKKSSSFLREFQKIPNETQICSTNSIPTTTRKEMDGMDRNACGGVPSGLTSARPGSPWCHPRRHTKDPSLACAAEHAHAVRPENDFSNFTLYSLDY